MTFSVEKNKSYNDDCFHLRSTEIVSLKLLFFFPNDKIRNEYFGVYIMFDIVGN